MISKGPVAKEFLKEMVSEPLPPLPPITVPEVENLLTSGVATETMPTFDDPAGLLNFHLGK